MNNFLTRLVMRSSSPDQAGISGAPSIVKPRVGSRFENRQTVEGGWQDQGVAHDNSFDADQSVETFQDENKPANHREAADTNSSIEKHQQNRVSEHPGRPVGELSNKPILSEISSITELPEKPDTGLTNKLSRSPAITRHQDNVQNVTTPVISGMQNTNEPDVSTERKGVVLSNDNTILSGDVPSVTRSSEESGNVSSQGEMAENKIQTVVTDKAHSKTNQAEPGEILSPQTTSIEIQRKVMPGLADPAANTPVTAARTFSNNQSDARAAGGVSGIESTPSDTDHHFEIGNIEQDIITPRKGLPPVRSQPSSKTDFIETGMSSESSEIAEVITAESTTRTRPDKFPLEKSQVENRVLKTTSVVNTRLLHDDSALHVDPKINLAEASVERAAHGVVPAARESIYSQHVPPVANKTESPRTTEPQPVVKVSIGRIEIRSNAPQPQHVQAPQAPRSRGPAVSLNEYLKGRAK